MSINSFCCQCPIYIKYPTLFKNNPIHHVHTRKATFVLPFLLLLKEKAVSVALDRQRFRLQFEKLNVQGLWRFQFYLEEDTDLAFRKHLLSVKLTKP